MTKWRPKQCSKVQEEDFAIIKIKLTDNLSPTQLKTSHKVGRFFFLIRTQIAYCVWDQQQGP